MQQEGIYDQKKEQIVNRSELQHGNTNRNDSQVRTALATWSDGLRKHIDRRNSTERKIHYVV